MKVALFQLPTVSLELEGYIDNPIELLNNYTNIMPISIPHVASQISEVLGWDVSIVDMKRNPDIKTANYKSFDYEGFRINAFRLGKPWESIEDLIGESDVVGYSAHWGFEREIAGQFTRLVKKVNPRARIMTGGADMKEALEFYREIGTDFIFTDDFLPTKLQEVIGIEEQQVITGRYPLERLVTPAFDLLGDLSDYTMSHDGPLPSETPSPLGFIKFTRGCTNDCDFCTTRLSRYDALSLEDGLKTIDYYVSSGIRTFDIVDDNLILQLAPERKNASRGRERVISWMRRLKEHNVAWSFPNGLQVSLLMKDGKPDEELLNALFYTDMRAGGKRRGCVDLYFPIEDFAQRERYKKLMSLEDQLLMIEEVAKRKIPRIAFGVVVPPDADEEWFKITKENYHKVREIVRAASNGETKARYAVLNPIPIALLKYQLNNKYPEHPELLNFYTPVFDNVFLTARQLFEHSMKLTKDVDPVNYEEKARGRYGYG